MEVPLLISDFIERGEQVYGKQAGLIDEPDPPGGGLGEVSFGRVAQLARAQAAALDRMGIATGERVAVVSQNSARLLTSFYGVSGFGRILVPINFRLSPGEIEYILEHRRIAIAGGPGVAESLADIKGPRRIVLGNDTDSELYLENTEPRVWQGTRTTPPLSITQVALLHGRKAFSLPIETCGSTP